MKYKFSFFLLLIITMILASACRESAQSTPTPNTPPIDITVELKPDPPSIGDAVLFVTLANMDGTPINDATVAVKGDMNHAGMVPVIGVSENVPEDGRYEVPFEWSMGGEWILSVSVILAEGGMTTEQFEYMVASERAEETEEFASVDLGVDAVLEGVEETEEPIGDCSLPPTPEPGATPGETEMGSCAIVFPTREGETTEEAP